MRENKTLTVCYNVEITTNIEKNVANIAAAL